MQNEPRGAMGSVAHDRPSLRQRLAAEIDPASLVAFRIAFGLLIVWEACRYFQYGWIEQIYLRPGFLFSYPGFEWVKPWPGIGLHLHFFAIGVLGALVAVGLWYRAACLLLSGALWYVVLLDKAAYLNHLYLAAVLAGLMAVVPLRRLSLREKAPFRGAKGDDRGRLVQSDPLPRWCLWLLRFQVALPYVFGGVAKLNPDWLAGQPMGLWLSRMAEHAPGIPFLAESWAGVAVGYLAIVFDLCIVPALLWRPSRRWALVAAIGFHLLNAVMFRIGIFPSLMIAGTTLFLSPGWPRRFLPRRFARPPSGERSSPTPLPRRIVVVAAVWIALQTALPLRHFAYPGRVDWNERGSRFAWRMMVRDKACVLQFVIVDPHSGRSRPVDPRGILTATQIERMGQYPDMLRQFAVYLAATLQTSGSPRPEVHVVSLVSFNGRKPQSLVDPAVDLADPSAGADWMSPLIEPLPEQPWLVPLHDWTSHVPLPSWRPREPRM